MVVIPSDGSTVQAESLLKTDTGNLPPGRLTALACM